jgi:poly(A) polymerase
MKEALTYPIFQVIAETASEMQIPAYVVGGYVRDFIMGRPSEDIDIVTVGDGVELANNVASRLNEEVKVYVYKNFGTAMFVHKGIRKWRIEFVGARKESYRKNSRKPEVEAGTMEDDQKRRDFTINAMAISLQPDNYGMLIDPFGGVKDIDDRIIRTPLDPDITYSDDPLRMMRAIRLATQLKFEIHKQSLDAISRNRERILIISFERITEELNKIILSERPSVGFKLLDETGLLDIIFPELSLLKGAEFVDGKGHKDNFFHTLQVLDNVAKESESLWLRWAALLHDIAKPVTKKYDQKSGWTFYGHDYVGSKMIPSIFKKLKLPLNEKMKYVQKLVLLHLRPQVLSDEGITDSAVRRLLFDAGDDIDDLMLLCEADITSKNPRKVKKYLNNFKIVREKLQEIEGKDKLRNWQPPISGQDIMDAFNISPSREVGVIKIAIREAILDGRIGNNYYEAYEQMIKEGK